jgi:hypothetical protein
LQRAHRRTVSPAIWVTASGGGFPNARPRTRYDPLLSLSLSARLTAMQRELPVVPGRECTQATSEMTRRRATLQNHSQQ